MARHFVVLLNYGVKPVASEKVQAVLDSTKDWLRFSPQGWLVYTNLTAGILRDRLKAALAVENPNIVVVTSDMEDWAVYAQQVTREWLQRERTEALTGE
jgi:hypothetical protein